LDVPRELQRKLELNRKELEFLTARPWDPAAWHFVWPLVSSVVCAAWLASRHGLWSLETLLAGVVFAGVFVLCYRMRVALLLAREVIERYRTEK
jgi:hypothetical protein